MITMVCIHRKYLSVWKGYIIQANRSRTIPYRWKRPSSSEAMGYLHYGLLAFAYHGTISIEITR
jgi:hypothetical protein